MDNTAPKIFTPEWWKRREISLPWSNQFVQHFYTEDPSLLEDADTYNSIGIVFSNQRNGDIVPVGITALQNGKFIFQYHPDYLNSSYPPIAETLPKQKERFEAQGHMLPYFDNMPAEGWFGKAQGAALGDEHCKRDVHDKEQSTHMDGEALDARYHRFMMFGRDYPGATWVTYARVDPKLAEQSHEIMTQAALRSRSSISGMQPKLLAVEKEDGNLHPAGYWETSTHIVKLPPIATTNWNGLMEYEYMSILATKKLLPKDKCVDASLVNLHLDDGTTQEVLAIKRFDRDADGRKYPFEEMNQLLGRMNKDRYKGAYKDIANLVREKVGPEGVKQFYARLLCQFLLGNTDNHMKNFAMFHDLNTDKWELTPDYDLAPTVNYQRSTLALFATKHQPGKEGCESYANLDPKMLVNMGLSFGLTLDEIRAIGNDLVSHIDEAKDAVRNDPTPRLKRSAGLAARKGHSNDSLAEDFCARIDGRKQQLFSTFDRYISIQKDKGWVR